MMPEKRNVNAEVVIKDIGSLQSLIRRYLELYQQEKYITEKTYIWMSKSIYWLEGIIKAIRNRSKVIPGSDETVIHVFDTLKKGYSEYSGSTIAILKTGERVSVLQHINRSFLFLEPNLVKLEGLGYKTLPDIQHEHREKLEREGFKQISPEDMSLKGYHVIADYTDNLGGMARDEGRLAESSNHRLILVPPNKRKMGYVLNPPVYIKVIRSVGPAKQIGNEYKPTFVGKQGRLF